MDFMKRTGQCLLAVATMALVATSAQADTITVSGVTVTGTGPYTWTYHVFETNDGSTTRKGTTPTQNANNPGTSNSGVADYFTIYDFYGWDGNAPSVPNADWKVQTQSIGSSSLGNTPLVDSGIVNITWYYVGVANDTNWSRDFSVVSIYGAKTQGFYRSEDHRANGDKSFGGGFVDVPSPEPTTLFLMGSGLVSMAIARRRKNKNQP